MIVKNIKNRFLGVICLALCIIIFLAGLWPLNFHPVNKVEWLQDKNGIHFGGRGIVYSPEPFNDHKQALFQNRSISIEVLLQPETVPRCRSYIGQIFSLYNNSNKSEYFSLSQWKSSLLIRKRSVNSKKHRDYEEIGQRNALPMGKIRFVTITSNKNGTAIYIDGKLTKFSSNYTLIGKNKRLFGQIILGNSPTGKNVWTGNLFGLAIYNQSLKADQVFQHYQTWLYDGSPSTSEKEGLVSLYLFDEHHGPLVHSRLGLKHHLLIPTTFQVFQKTILVSPSRYYRLTLSYLKDILINIIGFIPFGFFFSSYLYNIKHFSRRRIYFITILLWGIISLIIELLQVYIPSRSSSLTDLICNILGTILGVILFHLTHQALHLINRDHSLSP